MALFAAIVLVLLYFLMPLKRARAESGLTPAYEERCTARRYLGSGIFGGFQGIRVAFYDNFFVLGSLLRRVIPYSSVELVEYKSLFVQMGIIIHTKKPDGKFALFAREPNRMADLFETKGIAVKRQ